MRRSAVPMILLLCVLFLVSACASSKKASRPWSPGDTVICPHCGREFPLPEKLGTDTSPQGSAPAKPSPLDPDKKRSIH